MPGTYYFLTKFAYFAYVWKDVHVFVGEDSDFGGWRSWKFLMGLFCGYLLVNWILYLDT